MISCALYLLHTAAAESACFCQRTCLPTCLALLPRRVPRVAKHMMRQTSDAAHATTHLQHSCGGTYLPLLAYLYAPAQHDSYSSARFWMDHLLHDTTHRTCLLVQVVCTQRALAAAQHGAARGSIQPESGCRAALPDLLPQLTLQLPALFVYAPPGTPVL